MQQQSQSFPGNAFNANPMQMQSRPPVRVEAHKGFFAVVSGQFSKVNPGDVVELEYSIARDVASKVKVVPPTTPLRRQENYLPERKRNPKPDAGTEISALRASVDALTQAVTAVLQRDAGSGGKGKP